MLMISNAFAQDLLGGSGRAASDTTSTTTMNPTIQMLITYGYFIPVIVIFYLLLIRPQQQQAKKTRAMLAGLKRGDHVVTSGGILGTIVGIDEQKVTLHVAKDVELQFARTAVVNVVPEGGAK